MQYPTMDRASAFALGLLPNFAPDAVKVVIRLGEKMYETAKNAKANKGTCLQLAMHAWESIEILLYILGVSVPSPAFDRAVDTLTDTLSTGVDLLKKYVDTTPIIRTILSNRFKKQFDDYEQRLNNHKDRLLFAMVAYTFGWLNKIQTRQGITLPLVEQKNQTTYYPTTQTRFLNLSY
ncbi:unnamed protein product [Adineta ricciae]|uniref:Mixed lineage kinase domain-containing protein n=1 Tax=Adineta ricciae TaxID=249248 RepID=A0A815ILM3_ADIRI|nr:unnamed protein product [Adineta ricciae]CAF1370461.1 unnamed protein product [Adineta ricciae]